MYELLVVSLVIYCALRVVLEIISAIVDGYRFRKIVECIKQDDYTQMCRIIDKLVKKYGSETEYQKRMMEYLTEIRA